MNKLRIVIIRARNEEVLKSSNEMNFFNEEATKLQCWTFLYNYLQSLGKEDRDPLGFYVKCQKYTEDLKSFESKKYYTARKITRLTDEEYSVLNGPVGYEISLWTDDFIPQAIEQEIDEEPA
jgi:hypothetical protein